MYVFPFQRCFCLNSFSFLRGIHFFVHRFLARCVYLLLWISRSEPQDQLKEKKSSIPNRMGRPEASYEHHRARRSMSQWLRDTSLRTTNSFRFARNGMLQDDVAHCAHLNCADLIFADEWIATSFLPVGPGIGYSRRSKLKLGAQNWAIFWIWMTHEVAEAAH